MECALSIREEVFVQGMGVPLSLEHDGREDKCKHYLLYKGEEAIATARLRPVGDNLKLERMAVLEKARGQQAGRQLLEYIIAELGEKKGALYLHAQEQVVGFYRKLGFSVCGSRFVEAGIGHFKMYYQHNDTLKTP